MSLFDIFKEKETVNTAARTKQGRQGRYLEPRVTVTNRRITNAIPLHYLEVAGITLDDKVDITYTKDGKFAMISVASNGLKLIRHNNSPTAFVRLTNKPEIYPDFIRAHGFADGDSISLIGDQVQYDKENGRIAFKLVRLG